jgi:hypothetical protein
MAPKNNPTPEEMNHDALIGVTDLGNPDGNLTLILKYNSS